MKINVGIYILFLIVNISCNKPPLEATEKPISIPFTWIHKPDSCFASEKIDFLLKGKFNPDGIKLCIFNDYGNTVLSPTKSGDDNFLFSIPSQFARISGISRYTLTNYGHIVESGKLLIKPKSHTVLLETYCGPPYVVASETDFSMLVVIPNDEYDNPNTTGYFSAEYNNDIEFTTYIPNGELLAFNKIFSRTKKGKILTKAFTDSVQSKTLDLSILANNPEDFTISYSRNTPYADGKELTTLKTSLLKDIYGNIIENGTMINFYLTTADSTHLKVYGKVTNGIATADFVHPTEEMEYTVQAFIENFAASDTLKIKYKKVKF